MRISRGIHEIPSIFKLIFYYFFFIILINFLFNIKSVIESMVKVMGHRQLIN